MKGKKRFFKWAAILGCGLFLGGLVLTGAGFVAMGCDLDTFVYSGAPVDEGASSLPEKGYTWEEVAFSREDSITALEIHASLGEVHLQGDGALEAPTLRYSPQSYRYHVEDGVLVMEDIDSRSGGRKWYQLIDLSGNSEKANVYLTVPQKLLDSVLVENDLGTVDLSDLETGSVTVHGDMGDVTLDNVSASEALTVTQSLGRVTLENCQGGTLVLENDMGDMEIASGTFTQGQLTASSGSIGVADSGFTSLHVENDMGDVNLVSTQVSGSAFCGVNMGNISLDSLACPDITLTADSGNVEGAIAGRREDYQIIVETDMGNSNLADQLGDGPNALQVTTNMGNIDIQFEG